MSIAGDVTIAVGLFLGGLGCNNTAEAVVPQPRDQGPADGILQASSRETERRALRPPSLRFSFATDMAKVGGVQQGEALVCDKVSCKSGTVAFGPYTTDVLAGERVATFKVSGVGVSSVETVATLDVYDSNSKQRLAVRAVEGAELPDEKQQSIAVAFTAPEKSKLEFRVGWHGEGEFRMYDVEVR